MEDSKLKVVSNELVVTDDLMITGTTQIDLTKVLDNAMEVSGLHDAYLQSQLNVQFIENNLRKEVDELQRVYQADLSEYSEAKTSELDARLALEKEQLTQEFLQKKVALEAQFDQQKDQIVDRILKEVLNQYGYRQNEEADALS